jgi:hypothetical protein
LLLVSLLIGLHIIEGLQYSLHKLILGGDHLFKVDIVVGVVVGLAIALAIPCVHHLMVWKKGKVRFYVTQLYGQGIEGKCCHFIYLNIDEVVDKAPKQPSTPNKHARPQTSISKQAMTNATLLLTRVTPNDSGIWRGSGCSLRAPCPNSGLRRWLSRCRCLALRGHWPDLYHPHVASDGGICVPQLDEESLNLTLSGQ